MNRQRRLIEGENEKGIARLAEFEVTIMKRLLLVSLAVVLAVSLVPISVAAATEAPPVFVMTWGDDLRDNNLNGRIDEDRRRTLRSP